jgi:hypothetical protein
MEKVKEKNESNVWEIQKVLKIQVEK